MAILKHVLVVEPDCGGHRASYIRWVAHGAAMSGYKTIIVSAEECVTHPILRKLSRELSTMVEIRGIPDPGLNRFSKNPIGLFRRQIAYREFFRRAYSLAAKSAAIKVVIVPYVDHCLHAIAVFGSPFAGTPWIGVVMRSAFHFSSMGVTKRKSRLRSVAEGWLFCRVLSSPRPVMLLTIDEMLCKYIQKKHSVFESRLRYLPDPAEVQGHASRDMSREDLGFSDRDFVMLVYGGIKRRKGIVQLINAALADIVDRNLRIVLAGPHDEGAKQFLRAPKIQAAYKSGKLQSYDRFLSDSEEYSFFQAADAVWLGYKGHTAMSGVMVQAGHLRKPTVACKEGLIGWITKESESGLVVDIEDSTAVRYAIQSLASDQRLASFLGENGYRRFSGHTAAEFAKIIAESLNSIANTA